MARLNEPPIAPAPPTDTIDAVKRRCLRQNRELAKTNSQQSIRIRSLENDASRLLAENLSLREQVLQLQNALEAQSTRLSFENIDSVKDRLEAKIEELGGLVAELGKLKRRKASPQCKSQTVATKRGPDERQWRSGLGLQEVENAMLPTILEDKYYPRRTMNADELQGILDEPDSQSPDIGPPPVSRFTNEDPIAFNPSPPPEEAAETANEPESELPVTLETRRKRRESGPNLNIRRISLFESPAEGSEESAARTVRVGAKRKFSVQEDEEKTQPQTEPFRFSRRNTPAPVEDEGGRDESRPQSPQRPVLGSKPVNTDPVLSPKKQRPDAREKPDKKPLPRSARGRLTITRSVEPKLPQLQLPEPLPVVEINLECLPPKTPAVEDIFSPPSTEPSTSRPDSKDTPPPVDLSSSDQTGMGGRPSRRARAQVSYKEPSLATKLRRPGKELVDAVVPPLHQRLSVEPQPPPSTGRKVIDKQEPGDCSWKPRGAVTGRGAGEEAEMGSPLRQKLDRREGGQDVKPGSAPEPPRLNSAAASNAISAMISETSTGKRKAPKSADPSSLDAATDGKGGNTKPTIIKQEPQEDLAIFDFNESSPVEVQSSTARARIDLAKAARNARRHSSIATSTATEERRSAPSNKPDGALPSVHKRTASGAVRSASATYSSKSMAGTRISTKEKQVTELPTSASNIDLRIKADGGDSSTGNLRAERAASRRKSMML